MGSRKELNASAGSREGGLGARGGAGLRTMVIVSLCLPLLCCFYLSREEDAPVGHWFPNVSLVAPTGKWAAVRSEACPADH